TSAAARGGPPEASRSFPSGGRTASILIALFFAFAVEAQSLRAITHLEPATGFTFGGSYSWIRGVDIVDETVSCDETCFGTRPCPVTVLFGDVPAHVYFAMPDIVAVEAPPHAAGLVDVTVRVAGKPELKLANGYTYSRDAFRTSENDYVPYLIPITSNQLAGGHGSVWVSEWSVFNASPERLLMIQCAPDAGVCTDPVVEAGRVETLQPTPRPAGLDGAFVYIPRKLTPDIVMELRVRDVSRESDGWGTELPLVPPVRFGHTHRLLDIPTDPSYRVTLRVYGNDDEHQPLVVTVYPLDGTQPIERRELSLDGTPAGDRHEFPTSPAYVQLDPITDAVRAAGHARVRIEVSTLAVGENPWDPSIWAFASITNNTTQQVTIVTPRQY
ncbi:MAG TPA: IPT/TIG domain-containing protein, partial [Thermoanaerobaculia bacterium]|nr:IPT/TIG domain-containing protein [Thermoanaerobaculia bacterium]